VSKISNIFHNNNAYVYGLMAADFSVIKIGRSRSRHQLAARVSAQRNNYLFNLADSFCLKYENERLAIEAEKSLLFELRDWRADFPRPFPGYTEYLVGASRNEIFRWILNKHSEGFISMEHILDELSLEDYEMPCVTVHATIAPPVFSVS